MDDLSLIIFKKNFLKGVSEKEQVKFFKEQLFSSAIQVGNLKIEVCDNEKAIFRDPAQDLIIVASLKKQTSRKMEMIPKDELISLSLEGDAKPDFILSFNFDKNWTFELQDGGLCEFIICKRN